MPDRKSHVIIYDFGNERWFNKDPMMSDFYMPFSCREKSPPIINRDGTDDADSVPRKYGPQAVFSSGKELYYTE